MTLTEARQLTLPFTVRWHGDGGWNWGTVFELARSANNNHVALINDGRTTVRKQLKSIVPSELGALPTTPARPRPQPAGARKPRRATNPAPAPKRAPAPASRVPARPSNTTFVRGGGVLSLRDIDRVLAALREGASQLDVALRFGVTKNVVAGVWARFGDPSHVVRTMANRLDALHAALDQVLADTRGVGRVPNEPKMRRVK